MTINAMGYQMHIAKTIRQGDGHYVLPIKDNQPTLHDDAATLFAEVSAEETGESAVTSMLQPSK